MARHSKNQSRNGDEQVAFPYHQLCGLAARLIAHHHADRTFSAAGLVHEAYLRLERHPHADWATPGLLYAAGALAMRRVLIENSRRSRTLRRGGDQDCVCLDEAQVATEPLPDHLQAVVDALKELAGLDPFKARLVELRFFQGFTIEECGVRLGISERSVKRHWMCTRAWLHGRLAVGITHATGRPLGSTDHLASMGTLPGVG
jgi:RNA polymerase sigma factor (TIGR02999 family)